MIKIKNRLLHIEFTYLLFEILFFIIILLDHYFIHPANSPFFKYIGQFILFFMSTSSFFCIIFLIFFIRKNINKSEFKKGFWISIFGLCLPILFFLFIITHLQ